MAKLDHVNYKGTIAEIVPELAPLFKTTETYAAGDHVIYEADWYTFKEAKEAGAWDATKVDGPFKVANEIAGLKEDLSDINESLEPYKVNLVDPSAPIVHLYGSGPQFFVADFIYTMPVKVKPNTKYTVMQTSPVSNDFHAWLSDDYPTVGGACTDLGRTSPTVFTTGANTNYISVIYYNSRQDSSPISADTLMVAEGEIDTFVPYTAIDPVLPESVTRAKLSDGVANDIDSKLPLVGYNVIDILSGFGKYSMTRGVINSASSRITTTPFYSLSGINTLEVVPLNDYYFDIAFYSGASQADYKVQMNWLNTSTAFDVTDFTHFRLSLRRADNGVIDVSEGVNIQVRGYYLVSSDMPTIPSVLDYSGEKISINPTCKYFNLLRNLSMIADTQFAFASYMQQGAAIYGDYVFMLRHHAKCSVVNLSSYTLVNEFSINAIPDNTHGNSANFSDIIPTGNTFPYLYVGRCSYQNEAQEGETIPQLNQCYVLNITTTGASLVQTILFMNDNTDYTYGTWDWMIDNSRERLICIGFAEAYGTARRSFIFKEFDLPSPTSETLITLHDSDVIEQWRVEDHNLQAFQGGTVFDKYIFVPLSNSTNEGVAVYDKYNHRQISYIQLDRSQTAELQSASVYDGSLYVVSADGRIDKVDF